MLFGNDNKLRKSKEIAKGPIHAQGEFRPAHKIWPLQAKFIVYGLLRPPVQAVSNCDVSAECI